MRLIISELDEIQLAELEEEFESRTGESVAGIISKRTPIAGEFYEPISAIAVSLAPAMISAVGALITLWIAKRKKEHKESIEFVWVGANGEQKTFRWATQDFEEDASTDTSVAKVISLLNGLTSGKG